MDGKTVVRTENAPAPFQGAPYSQAIKANGFVFVAGQLGFEPGQTEVVGPGIKAQTEQTIDNLEAILTEAGSRSRPDREDDGVPRLAERFPGYERGLCGADRGRASSPLDDRGRSPPVRRARRDRGHRARLTDAAMAHRARWPLVPEDLLPDSIVSGTGARVCNENAPEARQRARQNDREMTTLEFPESLAPALDAIVAVDEPYEGVYLVGGTVRDILLGERNFDVDVVVEGDAIGLARARRRKARRTGSRAQEVRHGGRPLRRRRAARPRDGPQRDVPRPGRAPHRVAGDDRGGPPPPRLHDQRDGRLPQGREPRRARRPVRGSRRPTGRADPRPARPLVHRRPDEDPQGDSLRGSVRVPDGRAHGRARARLHRHRARRRPLRGATPGRVDGAPRGRRRQPRDPTSGRAGSGEGSSPACRRRRGSRPPLRPVARAERAVTASGFPPGGSGSRRSRAGCLRPRSTSGSRGSKCETATSSRSKARLSRARRSPRACRATP